MVNALASRLKVALGNSPIWDPLTKREAALSPGDPIAVHLPNHLGDSVMAIPLVDAVEAQWDGPTTLFCQPSLHPLWERHAGRSRVVAMDPFRPRERRWQIESIREAAPRASVLLATGEEIAWMHARAGVPIRVGYDFWGRGILLTRRLRTDGRPTDPDLTREHLSLNYLRLFELLGLAAVAPDPTRPLLPAGGDGNREGDARVVHRLRTRLGLPDGDAFMTVAPLANDPGRCLPEAMTVAIAAAMAEWWGSPLLLLGLPAQRPRLEALRRAVGPPAYNLAGATDLGDLIALLSRSALTVACDSGIAHLSAALGTPTVTLSWYRWIEWIQPLGPRVRALDLHDVGYRVPEVVVRAARALIGDPPGTPGPPMGVLLQNAGGAK